MGCAAEGRHCHPVEREGEQPALLGNSRAPQPHRPSPWPPQKISVEEARRDRAQLLPGPGFGVCPYCSHPKCARYLLGAHHILWFRLVLEDTESKLPADLEAKCLINSPLPIPAGLSSLKRSPEPLGTCCEAPSSTWKTYLQAPCPGVGVRLKPRCASLAQRSLLTKTHLSPSPPRFV